MKDQIRFKSVSNPDKYGFVYESDSTAHWDQCYRASGILSLNSFYFETYGDGATQHSGLCCVPASIDIGADWLLSLAKHLVENPEN